MKITFLLPALFITVVGCGGSSGNEDLESRAPNGENKGASDADGVTTKTLFSCADDGKGWSSPPARMVVDRTGKSMFRVSGRELSVERVNKVTGLSGLATERYDFLTTDGRVLLVFGRGDAPVMIQLGRNLDPSGNELVLREDPDAEWWRCPLSDRSGVLEVILLDALVTESGGKSMSARTE